MPSICRRLRCAKFNQISDGPNFGAVKSAETTVLCNPVLGAARANELIAAVAGLDRFGPVAALRRLLRG